MQLSDTHGGHPSNLDDHTPRMIDFGLDPNLRAGDFTTAVNPQNDVPSTAQPKSSADPGFSTGPSSNTYPAAPGHSASFINERPTSTLSRCNSWSSISHALLYEFPISLGMAAAQMQGKESHEEIPAATISKKSSVWLTRPGATWDMAFFLKSTGPPSSKENSSKEEPKKVNTKMGLGIFKKKKDDGAVGEKVCLTERAVGHSSLEDRVQAKVTLQGRSTPERVRLILILVPS
jgi:hypothetical protein